MQLFICQYCHSERRNSNSWHNHERRCPSNPNRVYKNGMQGKEGSNQFKKARILGIPIPIYDRSNIPLSGCVIATKEQRSIWAKNAGTGGYKENAGRSKKFRVNDSYGNSVVLQSTYELLCSDILNELSINWIRPKHLKYDDKKYFADFYLTDYNIYLDPKNKYKAKLDEEKIQKVIDFNNVKVYILTEDKLNKQYIQMLVSPNGEGLG